MLVSLVDMPDAREPALQQWGAWSPAAAFLHLSSRDVAYEVQPAALRDGTIIAPFVPAALKSAPPNAAAIALPEFAAVDNVARAAVERRTWRSFGAEPISLDQLSTLCGLTFGVQAWMVFDGVEPQALKTSPSGGARHSIEAYVCARNVDGLAPGIYHYMPDAHALALLRDGFTSDDANEFLAGQFWFRDAAAMIVMTSVVERVQARYNHPKAYRNLHIEAGHLAQTFCLLATEMKLAPYCTAAMADSAIEAVLGVDCLREPVLYIAGVGARPAEGWNPNPFNDVRAVLEPPAYRRRSD